MQSAQKSRWQRTAFDWNAYSNRSGGLRLLRQGRIHVDTLITTQDGFSDSVHWQIIVALFPDLIKASKLTQTTSYGERVSLRRRLMLPADVNGVMARKLLECAYGERVALDRGCLREFYLIARDYNIDEAMNICLTFASSLLDVNNCIHLLLVSLKHRHQRLRRSAYIMIRSNFKLIIHVNDDFHLLPSNYLKRLLLDDFLKLSEDEEFAWLAIVRWTEQRKMTLREMIELYNQMVTAVPIPTFWPNAPDQRANKEFSLRFPRRGLMNPQPETTINFYTQAIPFDWTSSAIVNKVIDTKEGSAAISFLQAEDIVNPSIMEREMELFGMIKCLRFMRFRSLNAFNVIITHDIIRGNDRLEQLINHMRLVYMIKKKIPLDRAHLDLIAPGSLDKIKLNEMKGPRKALRLAVGFVKNRQSKLWGESEPRISLELENPSKLKDEQLVRQESDFEQITDECLKWADKPRVPNSVALLIGGWHDGAVSKSLVAYDFICDKWFKLNIRLPEPRAFHASCSLPRTSQIYIMGGTNGEQILDSVLRFDPSSDIISSSSSTGGRCKKCKTTIDCDKHSHLGYRFHILCPMNERRCHLSGVFHSNGKLYALGGHDGHQRLRTGEWYDSKANKWHPIADMTIARSDASACSHDNKIFIAGGQISDQFIQSSVEFYKASDNTWTFAAPMIVPRMSFKLISFKNLLLAIGGTNGLMGGDEVGSVTRSVERYNPSQSSWSLCTPMSQKRSSFGVMNIEDNLIVAGGYGGRRRLKTCETLKIGHFVSNQQGPARPPVHLRLGLPQINNPLNHDRPQIPPEGRFPTTLLNGANRLFGLRGSPGPSLRSAMRWMKRADLPSKRSGFSIAVVGPLRNAKDLTFHGSKKRFKPGPCVIKQRSKWHKLKIVKRRKLIKHLKIALVVTVVIIMM